MFASIDPDQIAAAIAADGYCLVSNDQTVAIAEKVREEYFSSFRTFRLQSAGFTVTDLERGPIRKKNISSATGVSEPYAQVLQSTYYPKQHAYPGIAEAFALIIAIRNQLTHQSLDFGDHPQQEKFWNARRIHHYPSGGGFMVSHKDTYFPNLLGDVGFLQVIYLLSKKSVDFNHGGGVIWDLADRRIDLEETGGFGSIVIFDGRIPHGVHDVDPQSEFSFDHPSGRLSAMANLYEYRGN